jgi:hypothetical protein
MLVEHAIEHAGGFDVGAGEADQLTTQWAAELRRPADRVTVVVERRPAGLLADTLYPASTSATRLVH